MKLLISVLVIVSYLYMSDASLTENEKQLLLDAHNTFRANIAQGKAPNQPPAANMKEMVIQYIKKL